MEPIVLAAKHALAAKLRNRNIGGGAAVLGFPDDHAAMNDMVRMLQHAEFAANQAQDWEAQIVSTSGTQQATYSGG
ncbi:hypothetical protein [Bradyrhizobium glycinis]|uniref:hypothetical protein n=1 Tax=Bradyrhizobium glycinis TaxID=2751812 RepID=UPI0018D968B6|nr:hypothetical protein [Bradyrhizobium glycinis]MBH5369912.1 hypothetical protein [Bradyrhizobium glycinis]